MPPIEVIGRLRGPLHIRCFACGHLVTWTPAEAARRLGGECTAPRARRRLRCSACGGRKVEFNARPTGIGGDSGGGGDA